MTFWPFHNKTLAAYWLKVFTIYALIEACIQLLFNFILNHFLSQRISNLGFHAIMWLFQCVMIWGIWWVANAVYGKRLVTQIFVNLVFFGVYSYFWFGPVQDCVRFLHQLLQQFTLPAAERLPTPVDTSLKYQVIKHSFRLSFFFLANYFYHYRLEEEQRLQMALVNKELHLKLLKWYLNPRFYFETIDYLKQLSNINPASCTRPILHLAKVMEYVIYDSREKLIAVSKEIHFLQHYTELINRKNGTVKFCISTSGVYEKLKVAPLLLAGFIDAIASGNDENPENEYLVNMRFTGNQMLFQMIGNLKNTDRSFLRENSSLYKRLKDLYEGRFYLHEMKNNNGIELGLTMYEQ